MQRDTLHVNRRYCFSNLQSTIQNIHHKKITVNKIKKVNDDDTFEYQNNRPNMFNLVLCLPLLPLCFDVNNYHSTSLLARDVIFVYVFVENNGKQEFKI